MLGDVERYRLKDLDRCQPGRAGIYAWYWLPGFSNRDLQEQSQSPDHGAKYFYQNVILPMERSEYQVQLGGQLLPSYKGRIQHLGIPPERVDEFFREFPSALAYLSSVFPSLVPCFTSPIYVGVASDLSNRLKQHRDMLYGFTDGGSATSARSFARQVRRVGIDPDDLMVFCNSMEGPRSVLSLEERTRLQSSPGEKSDCLFVEYILNRWAFPIYGGN